MGIGVGMTKFDRSPVEKDYSLDASDKKMNKDDKVSLEVARVLLVLNNVFRCTKNITGDWACGLMGHKEHTGHDLGLLDLTILSWAQFQFGS